MNINEFIAEHSISATYRAIPDNPNFTSDGKYPQNHWYVTLIRDMYPDLTREMKLYFTTGAGYGQRYERYPDVNARKPKVEPSVANVLDCLASDASDIDSTQDFAYWAVELGYEMKDLNKAVKSYAATLENSKNLESFLGDDLYRKLIDEVERL